MSIIHPNNIYGRGIRQLIYYLFLQLHVTLSSITYLAFDYKGILQSYLIISLTSYLSQDNHSLMIIDLDKNLKLSTKLRVSTCYLLVLIYYLAVVVHTVHTYYIFTTFSNYLKCPFIRCIIMSSLSSSLLSSFFSSLLSFYGYLLFFFIHLLISFAAS